MDEISAALISRALDGLMQRQVYIAQNIANANSETYRPVSVSFEDNLRLAAEQGADAIRDSSIEVHQSTRAVAGGDQRLDLELAAASQTAMRYSALVDILGRQMAMHRAVVSGGGNR